MPEAITSPEKPTVVEQEKRLQKILAENMKEIVSDSELYKKVMEAHLLIHHKLHESRPLGDVQVVVHRSSWHSMRTEGGVGENGEDISVGFVEHYGDGMSRTSYVPVAKRIKEDEGFRLVAEGEFNKDQAEKVAGMVDKLLSAKLSGDIPDLGQYLDQIYVPSNNNKVGLIPNSGVFANVLADLFE